MKRQRNVYPELAKVLSKGHRRHIRVASVRPDPPTAAEQATLRAAADAGRISQPVLVHRVANISASTMVVSNASHVADFLTAEDFLGVDNSPEMHAALVASGILAPALLASAPSSVRKSVKAARIKHASSVPMYRSIIMKAITVIDLFCARQPLTVLWKSQRETVHFMTTQEHQRALGSGGGILADEMGQGKTLGTLAFVLERLKDLCRREGKPYGKPTLIVVPKTLMQQWRHEIVQHFPPRTFSLLILSEAQNTDVEAEQILRKYNVVLTTYPTVVSAYKNTLMGATRRTNYSMLYKVTWERVIADEGHLFSNSDTCRFAAMCALPAHHRWIITGTPVLNDVHNVRAELQFIGVSPDYLPEIGSARSERVSGTIAAVKSTERLRTWHAEQTNFEYLLRIREVLRHVMLRRRDTREKFSRSVLIEQFETRAELDLYRHYEQHFRDTCLKLQKRSTETTSSGTTENVRDNEEDEYAYTGDEEEPTRGPLEEGELVDPLPTSVTRSALPPKRPVDMITVDILRLRQTCASAETIGNLNLPPHLLLDAGFDEVRRRVANTQIRVSAHAPASHVRHGVPSLSYLSAVVLLTRCAPILPMERQQPNADISWLYNQVPLATWNTLVPTRSHVVLLGDMLSHVRMRILPYFGTKVRMFVRYFKNVVPQDDKYIIFSEWVKVLKNIQHAFEHIGDRCLMLTGGQPTGDRDATLRLFEASNVARVMLVSMNIGSYGLNIPCANHASHAARWWSPHTEDQAEARILRPDQEKHCHFYNIIMAGTVEEDVMRMANEKQYIARLLLENDDKTLAFIAQMQQRFAKNDMVIDTDSATRLNNKIEDPATDFMDALSTLFGADATKGKTPGINAISRLVSKIMLTTATTTDL
jgi:SNF2 family DNA or RNA helicase